MRAKDLQTPMPIVRRETTAITAASLIAENGLIGLVIADKAGVPVAIVSAIDVLRLMLPGYVLDDLSLARVFDEAGTEELWGELHGRRIGDLIDDDGVSVHKILTVQAEATVIEIAALMVDAHTQIALITGLASDEPAFVTLPAVMNSILGFCRVVGEGAGSA